MSKVLLAILFCLAGAFSFSGEVLAQSSMPRGIVIVDAVSLAPKVPRAHEHMQVRLENALLPKGWMVVQVVSSADCATSTECMPRLARETSTQYVLRLSGEQNQDDGYNVTLELFQSSTSGVQKTKAYCDYCNVERMADVTGRTAIEMLASAVAEEDILKKRASEVPPLPPAPLVQPTPISSAVPPAFILPPKVAEPATYSWIPWVLIGAGAVTAGYGGWALTKDGKSTGGPAPGVPTFTQSNYSTEVLGWGCVLGGGVVAISSAIWVIAAHSRAVAISASPNHVALNMRF